MKRPDFWYTLDFKWKIMSGLDSHVSWNKVTLLGRSRRRSRRRHAAPPSVAQYAEYMPRSFQPAVHAKCRVHVHRAKASFPLLTIIGDIKTDEIVKYKFKLSNSFIKYEFDTVLPTRTERFVELIFIIDWLNNANTCALILVPRTVLRK